MKLPGFYQSLVSLNGSQFIDPRTSESRRKQFDDDRDTWRPYWRRGHGEEEVNEALRLQAARPNPLAGKRPASRKTKLYHSNLDLSNAGIVKKKVKMSKSVSMLGLHRGPGHDGPSSNRDSRHPMGRSSHRGSSLNLPRIEPEVDFSGETKSRGSSATNTQKSSSIGGRSHSLYDDEPSSESDDQDVYLSDEDPDVSRRNLDKAGDYIVEHDWILKEKLAKESREVTAMHKKVAIVLPDEDPLDTIRSRMEELNMMVTPKAEMGNFIDSIDPEQRDKILKYRDLDHTEIRKKKRKHWTPIHRFQDAVEKVLLIQRACHPRRKYLSEDKPDTAPDSVKKIKQTTKSDRETVNKSSLNIDMQMSLIAQPEFRTPDDIKRVIWMLRATKAFKKLFPAQLEEQLAKVVAYERYDNKRIIAQQGRNSERFYHVLTGKLIKVREYRLLSGVISREEGFVEKGTTTDPDEMTNNWPREHNLVTKGNVEVFVINKQDFINLLHTCNGPPIDFLQRLDLFKEFPCDEFLQSPDAIDFRYYGQEVVVVPDTNRTPWLHVVKTGQVKVIRQQNVIDVQNEDKFSGQPTEELGCVRPFSHAKAMLGLLATQRKMKTVVGAISFPEIMSRPMFERSNTDQFNLAAKLKRDRKDQHFDNPITRRHRPSLVNIHSTISEESTPSPRSPTKKPKPSVTLQTQDGSQGDNSSQRLSDIHEGSEFTASSPTIAITSPRLQSAPATNGEQSVNTDSPRHHSGQKSVLLPPIKAPPGQAQKKTDKENGEFVPHGTYLTRERTEFDQVYNQKQKKDIIQRKTYLQLDVLRPGDIFGLEHMEPQALASEAAGVSLISDGAEIIKISKRFFLQHAQNNTMLKVETMQREYMDSEEAKTVMYDKETWRQYKEVLLQRTVNGLHRNTVEKVP